MPCLVAAAAAAVACLGGPLTDIRSSPGTPTRCRYVGILRPSNRDRPAKTVVYGITPTTIKVDIGQQVTIDFCTVYVRKGTVG